MSARRCEKRLGIDSVHQLHGHILPFLGEQVCVAAAVCREWRQATLALPEQFWKLTALRLWPGITDMDALTQYASYRELVLDRNRSRHWTNRDVIVPFAAEILGKTLAMLPLHPPDQPLSQPRLGSPPNRSRSRAPA
mgnify:CR=1 FL=1